MDTKKKINREMESLPFIYKDYTASIEYSRQDNIFVGYVKGLIPIIDFCGKDIPELESEFHKKIDMYLDECKKEGKEPAKQYSGELPIKVTPEFNAKIAILCEEVGVSIEQFLLNAVMNEVSGLERTLENLQKVYEESYTEGEAEFYDEECDEDEPDEEDDISNVYLMNTMLSSNIFGRINSLGKVFFYRNIAGDITQHGDNAEGIEWRGKLLNVSDESEFTADTLEELYGKFIKAVDEFYEKNKDHKPYIDGRFGCKVSPFMHYIIETLADLYDEDVNIMLNYFVAIGVGVVLKKLKFNEDLFELYRRILGVE